MENCGDIQAKKPKTTPATTTKTNTRILPLKNKIVPRRIKPACKIQACFPARNNAVD